MILAESYCPDPKHCLKVYLKPVVRNEPDPRPCLTDLNKGMEKINRIHIEIRLILNVYIKHSFSQSIILL